MAIFNLLTYYLNESSLSHTFSTMLTAVFVVLTIIMVQPPVAVSETTGTLQPGFNQAMVELRDAQSAGATPSELSEPVALLNKALELNREALKLSASDEAIKHAELLTQVDQILTTVENQAIGLTSISSQRKSMNDFLTYLSGAIAAILGTIAYASAISLYRKYRIKRTFQMRVSHK